MCRRTFDSERGFVHPRVYTSFDFVNIRPKVMKRVMIGMQMFDARENERTTYIHISREFVFWLFWGGGTGRSCASTPFPITLHAKIISAVLRAPNRFKNDFPTYVRTYVRVGTRKLQTTPISGPMPHDTASQPNAHLASL